MPAARKDEFYPSALDNKPVKNDLKGVDRNDILDIVTVVIILMLSGISLLSIIAKWP